MLNRSFSAFDPKPPSSAYFGLMRNISDFAMW
jgi:hypothetical protein